MFYGWEGAQQATAEFLMWSQKNDDVLHYLALLQFKYNLLVDLLYRFYENYIWFG